jgi:hypothetical protein
MRDGTLARRIPARAPLAAADRLAPLSPAARGNRDPRSRSARRRRRELHELLARLLHRRAGARRHPRQRRHVRLWAGRKARRELHADDGGVGRLDVGHGRADPGNGVARPRRARDVEARDVFSVRRHARRRDRHALHADRRRPYAAHVPFGPRGGEHPARAHRRSLAQAIGLDARQRHWAWRRIHAARGEGHRGFSRRDSLFRIVVRRRHHRRRADQRADDRHGRDRPRGDAVAAGDRLARPERSVAHS